LQISFAEIRIFAAERALSSAMSEDTSEDHAKAAVAKAAEVLHSENTELKLAHSRLVLRTALVTEDLSAILSAIHGTAEGHSETIAAKAELLKRLHRRLTEVLEAGFRFDDSSIKHLSDALAVAKDCKLDTTPEYISAREIALDIQIARSLLQQALKGVASRHLLSDALGKSHARIADALRAPCRLRLQELLQGNLTQGMQTGHLQEAIVAARNSDTREYMPGLSLAGPLLNRPPCCS